MEKTLERFLRYHRASGHSPKTITYHEQTVSAFISFLRAEGATTALEGLQTDLVRRWIESQRERDLSPHTIATRVRSLKTFAAWVTAEEYVEKNPLVRLKVPRAGDTVKTTLTAKDVDSLLDTCDRKTVTGARDYAVLLLLFSTGIRASELCQLLLSDVDFDKGLIQIRKGKGAKFRVVPLGTSVERAINRYLAHRKRPDTGESGPLFLTDDSRPLAYTGLRQLLRRRGDKAGVHANPHLWRHSAAIAYLRNGGSLETLRLIMGHSDYATTLKYARLAGSDVVEAHATADPTRTLKHR